MKQYTVENIRNVAIVGHGGAGKTMLVEHMLYTAGAIDRVGTVESGNTQSDFDPLEIKRKFSMSAGVLPLEWNGCKINLIDVPGFPDFVGDLHGVAEVVEAMVLVAEAKRDLDVGFETAWDLAEKHGLAKLIFVNKLERDSADYEGLLETLHERYGRKVVGTQMPIGHKANFAGVLDLLNMKVYEGQDRGREFSEVPRGFVQEALVRREKMSEAAAEVDHLTDKYLNGDLLTETEIEEGLHYGIERGLVVPILLGSARTGIGVATLLDRICCELPSPAEAPKCICNGEIVSSLKDQRAHGVALDHQPGTLSLCFKTTADPFLGKVNFVRVFSGELHVDRTYWNVTKASPERLHNLVISHGKARESTDAIGTGDIGAIAKLATTQTGDTLSCSPSAEPLPQIHFPVPVFRMAIRPATKADEDKLGFAVERLLEEDPTLLYLRDPTTHQEIIEGLGDAHLDSVVDKLKIKFGVEVVTESARVPYRETIRTKSKAQGRHKRQTGGKGQFGDCWLEIEPLERGAGFQFENKVVGGAIPKNFIPAIEKGVRETMEHGLLAGFPAVDIKVTVVDGSYHDVDSNEQAFKTAGSLALRAAAQLANPAILEPVLELEVTVPDDCVGDVAGDLNGRRGRLLGMDPAERGHTKVRCQAPMSTMGRYALTLRSLTKGRGAFHQRFSHYEALPDEEQAKLTTRGDHSS